MGSGLQNSMREVVYSFVDALLAQQHSSAEEKQQRQRELLEPLLRHARQFVPFYRDSGRLDPLFGRGGNIDWERWSEIPLLTRGEVREAGDALYSTGLPEQHGKTSALFTSGSTGEPVRVLHSQIASDLVWPALMLRALKWHGVDPTKRFARIGTFSRENPPVLKPRLRKAWYHQFELMEIFGQRLDLPEAIRLPAIVEELIAFRPVCISINPVELEVLLAWDSQRRLRELGEITVMTSADQLMDSTKAVATQDYGWRSLNIYASNECGLMATSCPRCGQFHIHAETTLIELLDEDGRPAQAGERAWIVPTPLYNYAMPLIRYDHADQAIVGDDAKCQITLSAMGTIDGKLPTLFVFSDGSKVRPTLPASQVIEHLGAQAFQVAQIADDRCEFRVVAGRLKPEAMNFDAMTNLLRAKWWPGIKIEYRVVENLPGAGSRRKFPLFVREVGG
jgi:phenylacetate-CoA ligase